MFDKVIGFMVLFLLSGCSGEEAQLDSPKDKQEVLAQKKGKIFGELKFPIQEKEKKEENKK